jgi:disulfide bond formation protein DsbB
VAARTKVRNAWVYATLAYAALGLSLSFAMEHWGNITPCRLCYIQRWILVALLGICSVHPLIRSKAFVTGSIRVALVALVCVSTYHWFVQLGLVADPCFLPKEIGTLDDFRALLERPKGCADIGFSIFKLPISALNSLVSTCLVSSSFIRIKKFKEAVKLSNPRAKAGKCIDT